MTDDLGFEQAHQDMAFRRPSYLEKHGVWESKRSNLGSLHRNSTHSRLDGIFINRVNGVQVQIEIEAINASQWRWL